MSKLGPIEIKFDRLNPNPPSYLYRLRNKGHWRTHNLKDTGGWDLLSSALSHVRLGEMQKLGGIFLDAGCGHSPDAILALRLLGFTKAIKVDLWQPYINEPYFADRLTELENNNVSFIKADVCNLRGKVASNSISMIGCNAMIDLLKVEDRSLFYQEAHRILKKDGILSISYVPLVAGYGWGDGWNEIKAMQSIGFAQINRGHYNIVVMKKAK